MPLTVRVGLYEYPISPRKREPNGSGGADFGPTHCLDSSFYITHLLVSRMSFKAPVISGPSLGLGTFCYGLTLT